jgi:hypothetical protein
MKKLKAGNHGTPILAAKMEADQEKVLYAAPGYQRPTSPRKDKFRGRQLHHDTDNPFNDPENEWTHVHMHNYDAWALWAQEHNKLVSSQNWPTGWGHKTKVLVIDDGVDYDHEDLNRMMWKNPAETCGRTGIDDDPSGNDGDAVDDI